MFTKEEILPLTIYEFQLPQEILERLLSNCNAIDWDSEGHRENVISYGKSFLGQSLHKEKDYDYLTHYVNECLEEVRIDLMLDGIGGIKVCLMWANKSTEGEWHHSHIHPWSLLSGIIYVSGKTGKTWFSRPSEYLKISNFTSNKTVNHDLIYQKEPTPGTLLIFPSTLLHSVDNVMDNVPRITVSFNSFPTGPNELQRSHAGRCAYEII